jgi:hypothetical protein
MPFHPTRRAALRAFFLAPAAVLSMPAALTGRAVATAGGALLTGQALRVTGSAVADWGPIDLSNSRAVTGVVPAAVAALAAIEVAKPPAQAGASPTTPAEKGTV